MSRIQHWEPGARAVGRCPCGGRLLLVEEHRAGPVEAQCERCLDLTGVAREALAQIPAGPDPGSPEALGF